MSFQQSGLTLTFFARDYTVKEVGPFTNIFFNLLTLISVIAAVYGLVYVARKNSTGKNRIIGGILLVAGAVSAYLFYNGFPIRNPIEPEIFQQFNPIFIVVLTPVVIVFYAYLRKKNIEPSTPRKIAIGMILAAVAFAILAIGSFDLLSPTHLAGAPSPNRVSPYWLINTYLILTFGELFLSPMGISFVSKVAPPRFQGLMQGGWFAATAIGNQLLVVGSFIWGRFEVWHVWAIFVVCCILSAGFVFAIIKRLESVSE
jgi:POT family proton-dependent oligopeptide transporter